MSVIYSMLFSLPFEVLVLLIPALMLALSFHEFAHAYVAFRCGDETAALQGRLTMNPIAHLDLVGSLMILFVGFGWAKPVPVNPLLMRNPRRDIIKVSLAGPISNLILAFFGGLGMRIMIGFHLYVTFQTLFTFLQFFVWINIALAVFNMIPVPPLDGSRVLSVVLERKNPELVYNLNRYGPFILLAVIVLGRVGEYSILWLIMKPFINFFHWIFTGHGL